MDHQALNDLRMRVIRQESVTEDELRQACAYLANLREGVASEIKTPVEKTPKKQPSVAKAEARAILGDLLG